MEEIQDDNQEEFRPLSRTRKKKLAQEITQLASQLTEMPENQYKRLALSELLNSEVALARSTKGRGSHKRQIKHLAGVMRKLEPEVLQLQEQIQGLDQVSREEKKDFHQLERLRDQLCATSSFDDAFARMLTLYPQVDRKTISRLARSVHQHDDKRAAREIFKRLRDCLENPEG